MSAFMVSAIANSSESLVAIVAIKGFLTCVGSQVDVEVTLLREYLPAIVVVANI
jgi:hypothetical protein